MYRPEIILTRRDLGRLDTLLGDTVLERLGKSEPTCWTS